MVKIKKKGECGIVTAYFTRSKILRKLQITLADFRRLCILKGIFPRDPVKKRKILKGSSASTSIYSAKDIRHLLHEPIMAKLRERKAFLKRLGKYIAKREWSTVKRMEKSRPYYTLEHVIKERYPTFVDALRDLDDALCHVAIFACLPVSKGPQGRLVKSSADLCNEFMLYVMQTHALRKVFLSVKGIYYQAEVHGQLITWLVPYEFKHVIPPTVDLKVMLTFLEFYQALLGFVNFKLFTELDLPYPPRLDANMEDAGHGLMSLLKGIEGGAAAVQALASSKQEEALNGPVKMAIEEEKLKSILARDRQQGTTDDEAANKNKSDSPLKAGAEAEEEGDDLEKFVSNEDADAKNEEERKHQQAEDAQTDGSSADGLDEMRQLMEKKSELVAMKSLFSSCVFFISREVPRDTFIFIIKSFGGMVGWNHAYGNSPFGESDPRITHHIVDRPVQATLYMGRHYVQPQWVVDCVNAKKLLKEDLYGPNATLPYHASPFVDEKHDMARSLEEQQQQPLADDDDFEYLTKPIEEIEDDYSKEMVAETRGIAYSSYVEGTTDHGEEDEEEEDDDDDDEEEKEEQEDDEEDEGQREQEKAAQAKKRKTTKPKTGKTAAAAPAKKAEMGVKKQSGKLNQAEERRQLAVSMMTSKKRHLYKTLKRKIDQEQQEAEALNKRRKEVYKK